MAFLKIGERRRRDRIAHALYVTIIEQSRRPEFYVRHGVPDTLDGRFDLIVLHAFLVMRRLKGITSAGEEARAISQALFDLMFDDMDQNLREMGVGDMSVGKRVKQMARAFYGRVAAYEAALGGDGMAGALIRNLYGTVEAPPPPESPVAMAAYALQCAESLDGQDDSAILSGRVTFAEVAG
ncbi:hypothetical protein CU669_07445 [Paramagnetospirillum kuznetsovii]|uniref:Ubiquinol-cytochrome c chaperone domain-containing protein n=1 Tax=Paramagnetospirillum kuznetsovii TaxID=2053833 RepID=A0A364P047_9PROT|nr:ubiquinol-cytochrome C chaperone family protein [Paramagnetospirillum kuznetsovii]RAU22718.1 hypothetical protein CU669_07445 [Paramagnetospirillum kuznetsovii]